MDKAQKLKRLKRKAKKEGWAQWIRSKNDEEAVLEGCVFDQAKVDIVFEFFDILKLSKGRHAGKPFHLMEWEKSLLSQLYGWMRPEKTRRYRLASIWLPKKNGKSTLISCLILLHLMFDGESRAEIVGCAGSSKQCDVVFKEVKALIIASGLTNITESYRDTITFPARESKYYCLSKAAETADGWDLSACFFDELHRQKTPDLYETLRYSGAARDQPLLCTISTAGAYEPASIGWLQWEYARGIADDSIIDTQFFSFICCAEAEDDWEDEATWHKANCSLQNDTQEGLIKLDDFRRDFLEAQQTPAKQAAFKRFRLNIWNQISAHSIDPVKWNACNGAVDPSSWEKRPVFCGIDLAETKDTTSMVAICCVDDIWQIHPMIWLPENNLLQREKQDRALYCLWKDQGFLNCTEGNAVEYKRVLADILDFFKGKNIHGIAMDSHNAYWISEQLRDVHGYRVENHDQGTRAMNAPCKEVERRYLEGEFAHAGHPVLCHQAAHVKHKTDDNGNVRFLKGESYGRVDTMVSLAMATHLSMVGQTTSVYETEEAFWL